MPLPVGEVTKLINLYRARPDLFSDDQIEALDQQAESLKINFKPLQQQADVRKLAKQFTYGFGEGFTTIPMGKEPRTTYESIAHSLGHLAGFAPAILTAPVGLFTKGLMKVGAKGLAKGIEKRAFPALARLHELSIPMIGSRKAKGLLEAGLQKSKLDTLKFFKKGAPSRAIVEEAIGLGAASVVSGVWRGPDTYMNTFVHGAVAGGVFGGIGNFVGISKRLMGNEAQRKSAEAALKTGLGSAFLGIPSTVRGDPIESQIYEYLLGGFFGYQGRRPAYEVEGGKFITETIYTDTPEYALNPTKSPKWNQYSKKAQDYIQESATLQSAQWLAKNRDEGVTEAIVYQNAQFKAGKEKNYQVTPDDIARETRLLAYDQYVKERSKTKFEEAGDNAYPSDQKMDANDPTVIHDKNVLNLSRKLFDETTESKSVQEVANKLENLLKGHEENPNIEQFIIDARDQFTPEVVKKNEKALRRKFNQHVSPPREITLADYTGEGVTTERVTEKDGITLGKRYYNLPIHQLDKILGGSESGFETLSFIKVRREDPYSLEGRKLEAEGRNFEYVNPLDFKLDFENNSIDRYMKGHMLSELNEKLKSDGKYIYSGNKDKSQLIIADIKTDGHSLNTIINALASENLTAREIRDVYNKLSKEAKDKKHYEDMWISNILHDAIDNGIYLWGSGDLSGIKRLTQDGYGRNAADWNKRVQGLMDTGIPQHADTYGKDKLNYAIVEDMGLKSDTDGTLIVEHSTFDSGIKGMGFDAKSGHYKPTIVSQNENGSLLFVKSAGQRASQAWQDYMKKNGLDFVIFKSSAKRRGDMPIDIIEYKDGEYQGNVNVQQMNVNELRINPSTYENLSKQVGNIRMPLQLGGQLSVLQNKNAPQLFFDNVTKVSLGGSKEGKEIAAKKFVDAEAAKDIESMRLDDLPVEYIYKILSEESNSKAAKKIRAKIQKLESEGELDIVEEYFGDDMFREFHTRNQELANLAGGQFAPNTFMKHLRKQTNGALRKYLLSRYVNPNWKYAGKAWLKGNTPDQLKYSDAIALKSDTIVKKGEIYLDEAHWNMPVVRSDGVETTLGKLWTQYKAAKNKGEDVSKYEEALELVVIRIPADSVSGTRVLKFKGFTKQRGAGALTHDFDNRYLGGADKDSDSIFIFQGFEKNLKQAYKDQANERKHWTKEHKEHLDSLFETGQKEEPHVLEKYDPNKRYLAARGSVEGQGGLGYGLNAKMIIQEWADLLHNNGGKVSFERIYTTKGGYDKKGKYQEPKDIEMTFNLRLKDEKAQQLFRDLGVQVVNKSADASSNPYLISFMKYPDLLFKSIIEGDVVMKIDGKKFDKGSVLNYATLGRIPVDYKTKKDGITKYDSFNSYKKLLPSLKPSGKVTEGEQRVIPDWENTQDKIFDSSSKKHSSLFGIIANDMNKNGLTIGRLVPDNIFRTKDADDKNFINISVKFNRSAMRGKVSDGSKLIDSIFKDIETSSSAANKLMEINPLPDRNLGISSKEHHINVASEMVGKELGKMSAYELLTEKANQLIFELGETRAREILEPVIIEALKIKTEAHTLSNNESNTESKYRDFDARVEELKHNIIIEGALNKYNGAPVADIVDFVILSPFLSKLAESGQKKNLYWRPDYTKAGYSSESVYDKNVKAFFTKMEDIYQRSTKTDEVFEFAAPKTYREEDMTHEKARIITDSIKDKLSSEKKKDAKTALQTLALRTDLELRDKGLIGLDSKQEKEINTLTENLQKNKDWSENFNDRFTQFTDAVENRPRDSSTMTMTDVYALNRFFDSVYKKPISNQVEVWDWFRDPRTVSERMARFDSQTYEGMYVPVLTSKGLARKKLSKVMSPIGIIREYFKKIERETVSQIERISEQNLDRFSWRRTQNKEDTQMIMRIVKNKRENEPLTAEMEAWLGKTLTHEGKELTGREMIEIADKQLTSFFRDVGRKWLYGRERINWAKVDKRGAVGTINEYFIYNGESKLDVNNFLRKVLTTADVTTPTKIIGIEALMRYDFERKLEISMNKQIAKGKIANTKSARKSYRISYRKKAKFGIGEIDIEKYFPHLNIGYNKGALRDFNRFVEEQARSRYEAELLDGKTEVEAKKAADETRLFFQFYRENSNRESAQYEAQILDEGIGGESPHVALKRTIPELVGFDIRETVMDDYKKQLVRSYYRNLIAIQGNNRIDAMLKKNAFGKFSKKQKTELEGIYDNPTEVWADYLRIYLRDILGQPSTFNMRVLDSIEKGDPLKLKKSMYFQTSDRQMMKAAERYVKSFEGKKLEIPLFSEMPLQEGGKLTDKKGNLNDAQKEYIVRRIHDFARIEARYELLTLLANTGTFTANIYGGSTMTIASGGLKNFINSKSDKYIRNNLLKKRDGSYAIFFKDKSPVKTRKDFHKWLTEKGIIDTYIQNELDYNPEFRDSIKKLGTNGVKFISQLKKLLKANPNARDESIKDLAKRYGITDKVLQAGGWLMQKSERINRLDAFTTHALQSRERYGQYAKDISMADPYLFDMGLRGIETTQFLYHSAFRPAFMRTATGKVLTRFKLFAFQSVRTRKEFYKQAKMYGYKEGTPAYERFKDLFVIDMFTMALGAAFAYSLFDTALPPPWDWMQETSEWLFGDKKQRDSAFFGTYPRPIAPLQIITPPIARVPQAMLELLNGDYERFADYTIHTLYPFGRIVRQVDKTFNEPYGTTFGRGMRQFTRLPVDKLIYKIEKAEKDERRVKKIKRMLGE